MGGFPFCFSYRKDIDIQGMPQQRGCLHEGYYAAGMNFQARPGVAEQKTGHIV